MAKIRQYYPVAHSLDLHDIIIAMYEDEGEEIVDEMFLTYEDFKAKDRRASRRKSEFHAEKRKVNKANCYAISEIESHKANKFLREIHTYKSYNRKPISNRVSISESEIESDTQTSYWNCAFDISERKAMFDALVRDYLECGNAIKPYDGNGYLICVNGYEFHTESPSEAWHYLFG